MTRSIIFPVLFLCAAAGLRAAEPADSLIHELQEIVVKANQQVTRLEGSTLVSTIAGSPLQDLGTAVDVLAQLPMLEVKDNTVSVIGRTNIEIYIDGRPMRDETELLNMLSSDLRKVELIMAPGAAYASTTGAVLKITSRRNFMHGLSITDRLQLQCRRKMSEMNYLDLSYRTGNWEIFANGTVNRDNFVIKGSTVNFLEYDRRPTTIGSSQHNTYPTTTGAVKAGFNYTDDLQSFGAYYRFNPERGEFNNTGTEWFDSESPLDRIIDRNIRAHSHLASVYYENKFGGRYRLHFDGDFKQSTADNRVATTYPQSENADVNSSDKRTSTLWAAKLYLDFPLWKGDFTVGTQDSHTDTRLDFRMLNSQVGQYIPSAVTDARQTSAALFASWARTFGSFSLSAGARYEYVDYDFRTDGIRDEDVSRRDHMLTPDLSFSYSFREDAHLSLSYKMATVKPPYLQLTGSLNYVGRHEIEGGNPALRDEKMHNMQLFGMWKDFIVQADFNRSLDTYAFVKQVYPADNLQLLLHPVNIDMSFLSLYFVWSRPVRRWTPNITVGMYRQWLVLDNMKHNRPIFSYYFDNTFSLPCDWTITANINGSSSGDMHTNRFGTTWFTMDASVGKSFLDKALQLKVSATDIFNTANNDWTMNTCGVTVAKRQSYDRRGISLSLIYRFNPRKSRYKGAPASESELNRL